MQARTSGIDNSARAWASRLKPAHGLVLLIALQLWLIVAHSPWRDELQAYLLVRDSVGLPGLFANLHYEGHPSLWYLLLGAAEAVFRSPYALTALQIAIALGTTTLVWLRAPFPAWLKLLILAGYFPLFEYGVIARSYGLGALLLFAWLALRRTPWGWLILALMANVAVNFALLSGCCVVAGLWIERRWSWAGAALWAAAGLAAVATLAPAHDVRTGLDVLAQPLTERFIHALRWQSAVLVSGADRRVALSLAGAAQPPRSARPGRLRRRVLRRPGHLVGPAGAAGERAGRIGLFFPGPDGHVGPALSHLSPPRRRSGASGHRAGVDAGRDQPDRSRRHEAPASLAGLHRLDGPQRRCAGCGPRVALSSYPSPTDGRRRGGSPHTICRPPPGPPIPATSAATSPPISAGRPTICRNSA